MADAKKGRGGVRLGAGRKPKPRTDPIVLAVPAAADEAGGKDDALKLLHDIAFGRIKVNSEQLRAAIAAVQYTHTKRHDGGKKEETAEAAKTAARKFAARAAPKLIVNNR